MVLRAINWPEVRVEVSNFFQVLCNLENAEKKITSFLAPSFSHDG